MNYEEYIRSDAWKSKRLLVKQRANGKCENPECGVKLRRGWHCHHLTYTRFGNELLEDLQALCENCHRELHDLPPLPHWKKRKNKKPSIHYPYGRRKNGKAYPRGMPQAVMLTSSELKRRRLNYQPMSLGEFYAANTQRPPKKKWGPQFRHKQPRPVKFTPTKDPKPWNPNQCRVSAYNP